MQNGQMEVGLAEEEAAPSMPRPRNEPTFDTLTTERAGRGTVARNPRIVAISRISNILDGLDAASRGRAVRFIVEEYADHLGC